MSSFAFQTFRSGARSPLNDTFRSMLSERSNSNTRQAEIRRLREDHEFRSALKEAIASIVTLPKLRNRVKEELPFLDEEQSNIKVQSNANAAKDARKRLFEKKRQDEQKYENGLSNLVERTTKEMTSARANNLRIMLSKKWSEHKNAYRIVSKVSNRSQERINHMIDNRYHL